MSSSVDYYLKGFVHGCGQKHFFELFNSDLFKKHSAAFTATYPDFNKICCFFLYSFFFVFFFLYCWTSGILAGRYIWQKNLHTQTQPSFIGNFQNFANVLSV